MAALLSSISSREFCTSKHLKGPGASLERRFLSSKYTILLCQNFRNGPGHSAVAISKPVFINSSSPVTTTRRCVLARSRSSNRAFFTATYEFSTRRRWYRFYGGCCEISAGNKKPACELLSSLISSHVLQLTNFPVEAVDFDSKRVRNRVSLKIRIGNFWNLSSIVHGSKDNFAVIYNLWDKIFSILSIRKLIFCPWGRNFASNSEQKSPIYIKLYLLYSTFIISILLQNIFITSILL